MSANEFQNQSRFERFLPCESYDLLSLSELQPALCRWISFSIGERIFSCCVLIFIIIGLVYLSRYCIKRLPVLLFHCNEVACGWRILACYYSIGVIALLWIPLNPVLSGLMIIFVFISLVLGFIDVKTYYLPDVLVFLLLWSGVIYHLCHPYLAIELSLYGVMTGYIAVMLLASVMKQSYCRTMIGQGDIKLIAAFSAWLGILVLPYFLFTAALLGIGHFGVLYLMRREAVEKIPFGVAITLSGMGWQYLTLI